MIPQRLLIKYIGNIMVKLNTRIFYLISLSFFIYSFVSENIVLFNIALFSLLISLLDGIYLYNLTGFNSRRYWRQNYNKSNGYFFYHCCGNNILITYQPYIQQDSSNLSESSEQSE